MAYTIAALIACGVLVVLLCVEQVRRAKQDSHIRKLERERDAWKIAAAHWENEAHK